MNIAFFFARKYSILVTILIQIYCCQSWLRPHMYPSLTQTRPPSIAQPHQDFFILFWNNFKTILKNFHQFGLILRY